MTGTSVLLTVLPYVALLLAICGGLYRYFTHRFSYSSLSSQLLENRKLFWGSVPWHYGIIPILLAHLLAGLFPRASAWVLTGTRLLVLELLGMALGLFTVFGIVALIVRRVASRKALRPVTSAMDWLLLFLLAVQSIAGVAIALFARWGSRWYVDVAAPWFWSIVQLAPEGRTVSPLPGWVQFHFVIGFLILLLFPLTRLAHLAVFPIFYLWRPYQVVIWNWRRRPSATSRVALRPSREEPRGEVPPKKISDGPGAAAAQECPRERHSHSAGAAEEDADLARRRFLNRVSLALGGIAAALIAVPSVAFLLGLRRAPQVWRPVGRVDQFPLGSTSKVAFEDPSPLPWAGVTAQTAAWLRRDDETRFVAFAINCSHLGCPVRWLPAADLFMCPCHGGVFYRDGKVAAGPPPKPLTRYPARVRDGTVEILVMPVPIT